MKNMAIAFLLLFAWQSSAQQIMVIHQKGQPDVRIPISDIAKLTFDLSGPQVSAKPISINKIKTVLANIIPNPFTTKIEYTLPNPAMVRIRVFDIQGKMVRMLTNSKMDAGQYSATWNSCSESGIKVGNGSYIINIEIDGKSISKSLFIIN